MPGERCASDPRALFAALFALLAVASCGSESGSRIELGRPPIVVIVLDALDAGHLSQFGNERSTSPNLDALAAEGVSFPEAYSPAPYTLAAIPSILTGRLPGTHGLVNNNSVLGESEVTLAEILGAAGYRTAGAVSNLNGASTFGCAQGFEEFVEVFLAEDGRSVDRRYGEHGFHFARALDFPPIVERFLAGDDGRPPFLYLHILEPHEPYAPPESFRSRYIDPEYAGAYAQGDSAMLIQGRKGERPFTPDDKVAIEALYDANLAHVDSVVGTILGQLDAAGILDEALVIVTSDHGEAFWQHDVQGHNSTLYDEMLHVPLIVRFPKGKGPAPGARPAGLVSPMDLVPSLCEWLNVRLPAAPLDGRSLTPALFGEADLARGLLLRSHQPDPWYGLRTLHEKTILVRGVADTPSHVEHYLLDTDPAEQHNAFEEHRADADENLKLLGAYAIKSARTRAARGIPISGTETEMLKSIGYTDDE